MEGEWLFVKTISANIINDLCHIAFKIFMSAFMFLTDFISNFESNYIKIYNIPTTQHILLLTWMQKESMVTNDKN